MRKPWLMWIEGGCIVTAVWVLIALAACFVYWLFRRDDRWFCFFLLLCCTFAACERIPSLWENCATKCNGDEYVSHFKPRTMDGNMPECECMAEKDARWR